MVLKKIFVIISLCLIWGCGNSPKTEPTIFTFEDTDGGSYGCYSFDYPNQITGTIKYDQDFVVQNTDILYIGLVQVGHDEESLFTITILNNNCISEIDKNTINFSISYDENDVNNDFIYFLVIKYLREIESGLYEVLYASPDPNYILTDGYGTEIETDLVEYSHPNND